MTATLKPLYADQLTGQTGERGYLIENATDAADARSALLAGSPTSFNGLSRNDSASRVREQEAPGAYVGRAVYGTSQAGGGSTSDLSVGQTRILIGTTGGTTHISQALDVSATLPASDAPDHDKAIGVAEDGTVTGTDIFAGAFDFQIIKVINSNALNVAYIADIMSLCTPNPHTNDAAFNHLDSEGRMISLNEGEALFLGFNNSPRGGGEDELTFSFKGSANLTAVSIGSLGSIDKKGWEHLWTRYGPSVDTTAKAKIQVPKAAYAAKVYESGSYGKLQL